MYDRINFVNTIVSLFDYGQRVDIDIGIKNCLYINIFLRYRAMQLDSETRQWNKGHRTRCVRVDKRPQPNEGSNLWTVAIVSTQVVSQYTTTPPLQQPPFHWPPFVETFLISAVFHDRPSVSLGQVFR